MTEIDLHDSDCATHNEPAYPNGPCDCSVSAPNAPRMPDMADDLDLVGLEVAKAEGWRRYPPIADNAKRTGWLAFFDRQGRDEAPFPSGRSDLQRGYREGWDAAREWGANRLHLKIEPLQDGQDEWTQLAKLADAATQPFMSPSGAIHRRDEFQKAANPATVLALITRLRASEAAHTAEIDHHAHTARALAQAEAATAKAVERAECAENVLLGIALTDRYRRYPKQYADGGLRGQSGLRAVRALTGQHGSYLNDEDVERIYAERKAALPSTPPVAEEKL